MALFDRIHMICDYSSIVTMSLSCTISEKQPVTAENRVFFHIPPVQL